MKISFFFWIAVLTAIDTALPALAQGYGSTDGSSTGSTDEEAPLEPEAIPFRYNWVVFGAVVGTFLLVGLIGSFVGHLAGLELFFKRSLGAPPKSRFLAWLLRDVLEMTAADWSIVIGYLGICASWFSYYFIKAGDDESKFAIACGYLTLLNLAVVAIPACRFSPITYIVGGSWERALKLHRWLGVWTLLVMSGHGIGMCLYFKEPTASDTGAAYIMTWPTGEDETGADVIAPLPGVIAWIIFIVMGFFAIPPIRRRIFELFYFLHFLFIPGIVFACLHMDKLVGYLIPAFIVYGVDRLHRFWNSRIQSSRIISIQALPCGITRIEFKKKGPVPCASFRWKPEPGQYVFVNVPSISILQWHPFTISEMDMEAGIFTLNIKDLGKGTFTNDLYRLAQAQGQGADRELDSIVEDGSRGTVLAVTDEQPQVKTSKKIKIFVEGPYGRPSVDFSKYGVVVLIAGGIGITPVASIFQSLTSTGVPSEKGVDLQQVYVLWTVREFEMYENFEPLFKKAAPEFLNGVRLQVYVTKPAGSLPASRGPAEILSGRPNIEEYLEAIRKKHGDTKRIAVFGCGPNPLLDQVKRSVHHLNSLSNSFHVNIEVFAI